MNIPEGTQKRIDDLSTAILERRWDKANCVSLARLVKNAKRINYAMLSDGQIKRINALLDIAMKPQRR